MKNELLPNIVAAGALIAVALGATFARKLGYIDADTVTRVVMGGTGLLLLWYGNRMPKSFVPTAQAQRVTRVAGWSMALSGLVYAGLWAFASFPVALWLGCGVVAVGGGRLCAGAAPSRKTRRPARRR